MSKSIENLGTKRSRNEEGPTTSESAYSKAVSCLKKNGRWEIKGIPFIKSLDPYEAMSSLAQGYIISPGWKHQTFYLTPNGFTSLRDNSGLIVGLEQDNGKLLEAQFEQMSIVQKVKELRPAHVVKIGKLFILLPKIEVDEGRLFLENKSFICHDQRGDTIELERALLCFPFGHAKVLSARCLTEYFHCAISLAGFARSLKGALPGWIVKMLNVLESRVTSVKLIGLLSEPFVPPVALNLLNASLSISLSSSSISEILNSALTVPLSVRASFLEKTGKIHLPLLPDSRFCPAKDSDGTALTRKMLSELEDKDLVVITNKPFSLNHLPLFLAQETPVVVAESNSAFRRKSGKGQTVYEKVSVDTMKVGLLKQLLNILVQESESDSDEETDSKDVGSESQSIRLTSEKVIKLVSDDEEEEEEEELIDYSS